MKITLEQFQSYIGPIQEEDLKYIDAYAGENIFASIPNGGIFEYVTVPHSHPAYLFAIMSHRTFYLEYNNDLLSMKTGELLSIYPGTVHAEVPLDYQSRYLVIAMKKDFFERQLVASGGVVKDFGVAFFQGVEGLIPYIEDYMMTVAESDRINDEIQILEDIIIHKIINAVTQQPLHKMSSVVDEEIGYSLKYMFDHIAEPLKLKDLVRTTTYSTATYSRKFKEELDFSPMNYLNTIRIEKAKHLLGAPEKKIKDIAVEVGYKDLTHFSKNFKGVVGVSPKMFRDKII